MEGANRPLEWHRASEACMAGWLLAGFYPSIDLLFSDFQQAQQNIHLAGSSIDRSAGSIMKFLGNTIAVPGPSRMCVGSSFIIRIIIVEMVQRAESKSDSGQRGECLLLNKNKMHPPGAGTADYLCRRLSGSRQDRTRNHKL